ncbi:hypothetical protein Tco_0803808 [Tanacetum coccineum]|uniref:Uncharacterized protein n=1 Tax=Tanacetum coccineum TaxID=301880 RepID=A0ABQ5A2L6_9ASTR
MTLEEAQEQIRYLKRLADQKAAEEKIKKSLQRINVEAQKAELAEYKARRTKMLEEYNHYIHFRAHPVIGKSGLVIRELEAGFFYFNANFDLVFQRESEFHKTSTVQLIKLFKHIKQDSPEAKEMYKIMKLEIESRGDVNRAREIVRTNSDGMGIDIQAECKASKGSEDQLSAKHQLMIKGLTDSIALASNLRDIEVRDIVKEVKDYLKTYSPAKMDIKCKWNLSVPPKCLGGKFHKDKAWAK